MLETDTDSSKDVKVRLEEEWDGFVRSFKESWNELLAEAVKYNTEYEKDRTQLPQLLSNLPRLRRTIKIPHPMLLPRATAYIATCDEMIKQSLIYKFGSTQVNNLTDAQWQNIRAGAKRRVEEGHEVPLITHENAHFAAYVSSQELPVSVDNPDMTLTIAVFFEEQSGFYVDTSSYQNTIDATALEPESLIRVFLAPDDPGEGDFAKAIFIARRYGIDISEALAQKGYPHPEKGVPSLSDKLLSPLRHWTDRRRKKQRV
jgi:hypothetical protein